jgi:predicted nuclease of predicted toxin-antitoxin system
LKPPEDLVIFLDRSLGKQIIASVLRTAGYTVEVHDDHFPPDASDEIWLSEVSRRGWVVFTKDKRIRYRAPELAAVSATNASVFTLTAGSIQAQEMADIFILALPKIRIFFATKPPPYIVTVSRSGALSQVYPRRGEN